MAEVIDTTGLPDELIAQLSKAKRHRVTQDEIVLAIMQHKGTPCSIDWLLVQIYKTEGQIWRRSAVNAVTCRLHKLGQIERISAGVYAYKKEQ